MTERLYYDDSYTVAFTARIVKRQTVENRPAVILDRTYFYPTGGGQPHDTGTIGGVRVVDVLTNDEDKSVVHVLDGDVPGEEAACQVDWARRLDHMQHHTGQHILTQAFVQVAGANTVGFHLGTDSVTIDLDVKTVDAQTVTAAEELANQVIYENRPVSAYVIDPENAEHVRIRRIPAHLLTAGLRVIDVDGFDMTACGGTHVARTGDIGIIKVIKLEKRGDKTRVEFRCGGRALRDYREKNDIANRLAAELTCSQAEIPQAVARQREDFKQLQRALKAAANQLLEYEAAHLHHSAVEHGGIRIIKAAFADRDPGEVRALASSLVQTPGVVALLGTAGEKAQVFLARSDNLPQDMNTLLQRVMPILGSARGGGRPNFSQGGGIKADTVQVQSVLDEAERVILASD